MTLEYLAISTITYRTDNIKRFSEGELLLLRKYIG